MGRRAIAYIDGFNFYHGAVRGTAYKWLDLVSLMDDLLRGCSVSAVKYFTAKVDDRPDDPGQSQRQEVYLSALKAHCGDRLQVIHGSFRTHERWARLAKPTPDGTNFVRVWRTEEKGSDVNLGSHLVWDACHREMGVAAVVSNDSDLQTPVDMAVNLGVSVVTVNPHLVKKQPAHLVGTDTRRLTKGRLWRNRLPDPVVDGEDAELHCPTEWKP